MSNIQDNTLYYKTLRFFVSFPYKRFFRQIEIRGTDHIPYGDPVIFAANHQSALLDALAILFFQKRPVVFMARADMFQNKIAAKFLKSLKIAPIYRIRDGFENLTKNETQMDVAVNVLLDCGQMCLMPEGNHGNQHKLRPLVKGLFRIAYSAEERLKDKAHVKIIPVGIDYNFYRHAGADLVVTYGKPIEVKDYIDLFKDSNANGLNIIRNTLEAAISSLMHDIRSTSHYEDIYDLCCLGTPAYLEVLLENEAETEATTVAGLRFDARRSLGMMLDKVEMENPTQFSEWNALCGKLRTLPGSPAEISEWMDEKRGVGYSVVLAILSILLIPGFLLNLPAWLMSRLISKGMEDTQMRSTFSFVLGMFMNAFVYIMAALLIGSVMQATLIQSVCVLFFLFCLGVVSERARQSLRIPLRRWWYSFGSRKTQLEACKKDYEQLKESLKNFLRKDL
ncbi:MAG: 1-acyl-sn-glycerol-3-phosphate acyltransferase [Bacteroidales bacterium]|nr:1-acyl-sn-glycerol-3-phosphate acyltransferase [Bacteroidales bacterium]